MAQEFLWGKISSITRGFWFLVHTSGYTCNATNVCETGMCSLWDRFFVPKAIWF